MSSEALQVAKVFRNLLKAVKKHIGKEDNKKHFREYVIEEFRKNSILSDFSSIQQKIKLARDYTVLLNSVHHHKDLLFSYNIAVDRSDETKRILGKSAASVGLQLPELQRNWVVSFRTRMEEDMPISRRPGIKPHRVVKSKGSSVSVASKKACVF